MIISRRNFLKASTLSLPSLMLFGKDAFSIPNQESHFFVMLRATGGMDATLGIDPQLMPEGGTPNDLFLEYSPEDIIHAEGLKLGPAAKSLVPFAKKCAVINGIMMKRDAGHDPVLQYISSGKGDGSAALLPIELAATFGSGPYGVMSTGNTYAADRTIPISTPNDIFKEKNGTLLSDVLKPLEPNQDQISPLAVALRNIISSRSTTLKLLQAINDVQKSHGDASLHVQAMIASLLSGACQQALIDVIEQGRLDTHSDHVKNHLRLQTQVWDSVVDIFKRFEKIPYQNGSLMDYTTFMVVTEFSRTPNLNGAKGKDHNTDTNSVLFAGKGINGGKTVGSSHVIITKKSSTGFPLHIATAIDPKTGEPAQTPKGATFILPENIASTVAQIFGNPKGFDVNPNNPVLRGILKN